MKDQREKQTKKKKEWKQTLGLKEKKHWGNQHRKTQVLMDSIYKMELQLGEVWVYQISHEVLNNHLC